MFTNNLCVCIYYSFGMTLWELAYERIPYKGKNLQDIQKHVTSNRREDTAPPHANVPNYFHHYIKIITQSK